MPFSMFRSFFSSTEIRNNKNKNSCKNSNGNGNTSLTCAASYPMSSSDQRKTSSDENNNYDDTNDKNGRFNQDNDNPSRNYLSPGATRRVTEDVSLSVDNMPPTQTLILLFY